jgi:hypothetical protein
MVSLEAGQEEVLFEVRRVDGAFSYGIYRFSTGLWEMQSARYTPQGTLAGFEVRTSQSYLDFDLAGLRLTDGFGSNWPIEDIHQNVGPDVATRPRHLRVENTVSGLCLRWDGAMGNHHEILTKDAVQDEWLPFWADRSVPPLGGLKLLSSQASPQRFFTIRERVLINGEPLAGSQINDMEQRYGLAPRPGRYWYDSKSGMYGVVGFPAYGFMMPGHDLGPVSSQASNGNSGVRINGRELCISEWSLWSLMLQSLIQEGAYWLDASGNIGLEGQSQPIRNLATIASSQGGNGGQQSDGFWSSRWSAGNVNAHGEGYVSVPGYGPVGFGF